MTDKNPADLAGWESAETCTWRERQWLDYRGGVQCTCDTYPETTSGPEEDCEIHGHPYEEWVKRAAEAEAELSRAEIVKPGHVQVRVDDIDPQTLSEWSQWAGCDPAETALLRVGCASIARQVGQGDQTADEQEIVGDGCECWVTPEHTWTTHYGAVEPGSQVEYNPRCPKHDEKPTSATVTLFCPVEGCGEPVEVWVQLCALKNIRDFYVTSECGGHRCKPEQPDEPTEFGARATITLPDGTREKWCRQFDGYCWANENGRLRSWDGLTQRGTVTIGWDE